jgi:hypothetical protein
VAENFGERREVDSMLLLYMLRLDSRKFTGMGLDCGKVLIIPVDANHFGDSPAAR